MVLTAFLVGINGVSVKPFHTIPCDATDATCGYIWLYRAILDVHVLCALRERGFWARHDCRVAQIVVASAAAMSDTVVTGALLQGGLAPPDLYTQPHA